MKKTFRSEAPLWVFTALNSCLYDMRMRIPGSRKHRASVKKMIKTLTYIIKIHPDENEGVVVLVRILSQKYNLPCFEDYILHSTIMNHEVTMYDEIEFIPYPRVARSVNVKL